MYLIAGLGNPGDKYEHTRHNAGYEVIDVLADRYDIDVNTGKHKGLVGKGVIEGEKVILLKPVTYMNLSGESIIDALSYYKLDPESELIVIYDDISLRPGMLRVRPKGSAGGHNGIKNIIAHLGDDKFPRVRVGVGEKPKGWDLVDHVLGRYSDEDKKLNLQKVQVVFNSDEDKEIMKESFKRAADAVVSIMTGGIDKAMNDFNGITEDAK